MDQVAITQLRAQFESAHQWLEGTMADVTDEVANFPPPGRCATVGAHYIHHTFGEDALINMSLRGGAPLAATTFEGRTGADALPPQGEWADWGRSVRVNVDGARAYAQAVYANTDAYLATLSDADLLQDADMSMIGLDPMPLGRFLGGMLLIDAGAHCGEISCLKGVQGLRGYPF